LTALPSLHVAHTLCTAYFLSKIIPRRTWVFVTITILISASTLLVKHHYIADAVTGGLFGIITCMVVDAIWSGRVKARSLVQQESNTSLV
jgi:membrane-associated phospholipid phosphatase